MTAPSVVLPGYPPGGGGGGGTRSGTPWGSGDPPGGPGTPPGGSRYPPGGTWSGTPPGGVRVPPPGGYPVRSPFPGGYPVRYPPRGYPVRYPPLGGYPVRYPPRGGTQSGTPPGGVRVPPPLPHGILGNVAKHYGIWVPPPGVDRQTKWNYYLPVVLRTRAVIRYLTYHVIRNRHMGLAGESQIAEWYSFKRALASCAYGYMWLPVI